MKRSSNAQRQKRFREKQTSVQRQEEANAAKIRMQKLRAKNNNLPLIQSTSQACVVEEGTTNTYSELIDVDHGNVMLLSQMPKRNQSTAENDDVIMEVTQNDDEEHNVEYNQDDNVEYQPHRTTQWRHQQHVQNQTNEYLPISSHELFTKLKNYNKKELTEFFKDINCSPMKAALLLYLNSGYGRFDQYKEFDANLHNTDINVESICEEVKDEALNDKEMFDLIQSFFESHSFTEGNLYSCGLCGIREMEITGRYIFERCNLNEMEWVHYTEEETQKLNAMIDCGTITIPISATETCEIKPWLAKSFYASSIFPGRYYHVHPELVENDDRYEYTMVCPTCLKYPTATQEKSPLSIANGVDFGSFKRITELLEPNLHEQLILSQVRLFQTIVRVASNSGQRNYLRHNIKANAIMFIHDAPEMAIHDLNNNSFDNLMKVFLLMMKEKLITYQGKPLKHQLCWLVNLSSNNGFWF